MKNKIPLDTFIFTIFPSRDFEIVTFRPINYFLNAFHASRDVLLFTIKRYSNNYNFLQLQLLRLERFKTFIPFRKKIDISPTFTRK